MTMLSGYDALVGKDDIEDDAEQRQLLAVFEKVSIQLEQVTRKKIWPWKKTKAKRGIYLYGPVGTGKTFLMDLFYQEVSEPRKGRFHFHHFMQQVDVQLRRLQGHQDPLRYLAREIAKSLRLLCFDEFLVYDVAQAMILAELLQALFAEGIVLVTTSNTPPDDLYLNGVQRARFVPAIELIKSHCEVISLSHQRDYRLEREQSLETYFYPLNRDNEKKLAEQFITLETKIQNKGLLMIQNREIAFIQCGEKTVWFDFKAICNLQRSQLDYLEIADRFSTVFVSGIPDLNKNSSVFVILFIQLVDVLYDRGIRLVISAEVPLTELYVAGAMFNEFKRILSRLEEMQSLDYRRRHLPKPVCNLLPPMSL